MISFYALISYHIVSSINSIECRFIDKTDRKRHLPSWQDQALEERVSVDPCNHKSMVHVTRPHPALPRITERPDLIRCEYVKRKRWPSTFRLGSSVCHGCDRLSCRFHPRTQQVEEHVIVRRHETLGTGRVASSRAVEMPTQELIDPKELKDNIVLKHFPAHNLRKYQSEIITRIADGIAGESVVL
jgi:hypothetical protein